jgi:hypothetical protein
MDAAYSVLDAKARARKTACGRPPFQGPVPVGNSTANILVVLPCRKLKREHIGDVVRPKVAPELRGLLPTTLVAAAVIVRDTSLMPVRSQFCPE